MQCDRSSDSLNMQKRIPTHGEPEFNHVSRLIQSCNADHMEPNFDSSCLLQSKKGPSGAVSISKYQETRLLLALFSLLHLLPFISLQGTIAAAKFMCKWCSVYKFQSNI